MDQNEKRYWPFEVLPPERQTELHRQEIQFLERAYRAGRNPYMCGVEDFGATAGSRGGIIVFRGRSHWEVLLGTAEQVLWSAHVNDFERAADAVLLWLDGIGGAKIIEQLNGHLVQAAGNDILMTEYTPALP